MKNFLLAAGAIVGILYLGKKFSEPRELPSSPPPLPPPPSPATSPTSFNIKDGDKVISTEIPGVELAVLTTGVDTLLVATGKPITDPANQRTLPRSSVVQHIPRRRS